jgi:hypothetical protein
MKTYTWPELLEVVNNSEDTLPDFIKGFPEKYHDLVGLALSVAHWHPSEHKRLYDEDDTGSDACGLCAVTHLRDVPLFHCRGCPLDTAGYWCGDDSSPWSKVNDVRYSHGTLTKFRKAATRMYLVLEKLYAEEYERCLKLE